MQVTPTHLSINPQGPCIHELGHHDATSILQDLGRIHDPLARRSAPAPSPSNIPKSQYPLPSPPPLTAHPAAWHLLEEHSQSGLKDNHPPPVVPEEQRSRQRYDAAGRLHLVTATLSPGSTRLRQRAQRRIQRRVRRFEWSSFRTANSVEPTSTVDIRPHEGGAPTTRSRMPVSSVFFGSSGAAGQEPVTMNAERALPVLRVRRRRSRARRRDSSSRRSGFGAVKDT